MRAHTHTHTITHATPVVDAVADAALGERELRRLDRSRRVLREHHGLEPRRVGRRRVGATNGELGCGYSKLFCSCVIKQNINRVYSICRHNKAHIRTIFANRICLFSNDTTAWVRA